MTVSWEINESSFGDLMLSFDITVDILSHKWFLVFDFTWRSNPTLRWKMAENRSIFCTHLLTFAIGIKKK